VGDVNETVRFGRNNGLGIAIVQFLAQCIGIKGFVGKHGTKIQTTDQVWYTSDFTTLTGQQFEPCQIAQSIRQGQNFGGQTTF